MLPGMRSCTDHDQPGTRTAGLFRFSESAELSVLQWCGSSSPSRKNHQPDSLSWVADVRTRSSRHFSRTSSHDTRRPDIGTSSFWGIHPAFVKVDSAGVCLGLAVTPRTAQFYRSCMPNLWNVGMHPNIRNIAPCCRHCSIENSSQKSKSWSSAIAYSWKTHDTLSARSCPLHQVIAHRGGGGFATCSETADLRTLPRTGFVVTIDVVLL
jgi:hypothetical protein